MKILMSFVTGLFYLILGGNLLLVSSSALSFLTKFSSDIINFFTISIATSSPELAVSLQSKNFNSFEIFYGNIIGSNITNICLILGLCSLIKPIKTHKTNLKVILKLNFFAYLLIISIILFSNLNKKIIINRIIGLFLVILFIFYIKDILNQKKTNSHIKEKIKIKKKQIFLILFYSLLIILSLFLLNIGSLTLIHFVINLSNAYSILKSTISFSIMSIGTSLPEIIVSLISIYQKKPKIIINNIFESNLFNILFIIGLTEILFPSFEIINSETKIKLKIIFFILILFLIELLLFNFFKNKKKLMINRFTGITLIIFYMCFIFILIYFDQFF
jgi:cation:H+ antiporter